jgi:hypothetical protein
MLRTTTMIAAGVMALAATAAAEPYTDAGNNFRVTIPDGWQNDHDTDQLVKLSVISPRFQETRGLCGVLVTQTPQTRGKTQAELDADGDNAFDEDFWVKAISGVKEAQSAKLDGHGVRMVNGHKAYVAAATLSGASGDGSQLTAKTQQMLEMIPGQMFMILCAVRDSAFDQEEADISAFMNSFAPISDAPVAMAPSPGVTSLTMYSQPRFGGVSRVITQDQPNLALLGWRGTTASMSMAGSGAWEVCDGANFAGRCVTVTATLPTGPNGKGFSIASARHVKALLPQDPQIDVGALLQHAASRALAQ